MTLFTKKYIFYQYNIQYIYFTNFLKRINEVVILDNIYIIVMYYMIDVYIQSVIKDNYCITALLFGIVY